MQKNFKEYEAKYNYCADVEETDCYMGGHHCATCMHCFPGNYSVTVTGYDGRDVCTMSSRKS